MNEVQAVLNAWAVACRDVHHSRIKKVTALSKMIGMKIMFFHHGHYRIGKVIGAHEDQVRVLSEEALFVEVRNIRA